MVLGGGADHRGPADVDVLDAGLEIGSSRDGLFERIEIDHEQINRPNALRPHGGGMFSVVADREQAAMDLGMQSLDAAIHHLRKASDVGDVEDFKAGIGQRPAGAAG